jgi:hypothetical protein
MMPTPSQSAAATATPVHITAGPGSAFLIAERRDDADDQSRLEPFPEPDDERGHRQSPSRSRIIGLAA